MHEVKLRHWPEYTTDSPYWKCTLCQKVRNLAILVSRLFTGRYGNT